MPPSCGNEKLSSPSCSAPLPGLYPLPTILGPSPLTNLNAVPLTSPLGTHPVRLSRGTSPLAPHPEWHPSPLTQSGTPSPSPSATRVPGNEVLPPRHSCPAPTTRPPSCACTPRRQAATQQVSRWLPPAAGSRAALAWCVGGRSSALQERAGKEWGLHGLQVRAGKEWDMHGLGSSEHS